MKKYFNDCKTKQEAKKRYRELAKQYHPDRNKDIDTTNIMQIINAEFESIYKKLPTDKTNNTYANETDEQYNIRVSQEMQEILQAVAHLPITIEIIGSWIWVYGDDVHKYKSYLVGHDFRWSPNKKMYYWRLERDSMKGWRKKGGKTIEEIRETYGSQTVKAERQSIAS